MADNTTINTGTGGDVVRDVDRSGVKTQVVGLDLGIGGATERLMAATNDTPTGSEYAIPTRQAGPVPVKMLNPGAATPLATPYTYALGTLASATGNALPDAQDATVVVVNGVTTASATITAATLRFTDTIAGVAVNIDYVLPVTTAVATSGGAASYFVALPKGVLRTAQLILTFGATPAAGSVTAVVTLGQNSPISRTIPARVGTKSNVAGSASSGTILAANPDRLGAMVFNDSTAVLYLDETGGTASTSSYTTQVAPNQAWTIDANYTGLVTGIWGSATGNARVTEWTA